MDILDQENLLDEKSLLITIWTKPKLTFDFILKYCPKKYVSFLLILSGIVNAVDQNYQHLTEQRSYSVIIVIIVIVISGIFGWISGYIYAALLSWTGGWIKGKANTDQFITVISWAMVPFICSLILLIPKLLIFGDDLFYIDIHEQSLPKVVAYIIIKLVEALLSIWTLVITIKGIALIQNFNIKKAILNAILALLVIVVPIFIVVGIIYILQ